MIVTVATLNTLFDLGQRARDFITRFRAADGLAEQRAVAEEAITFAKEARVKLQEEIEGPAITPDQAREALANIAKGMADYETEFDNTRKGPTT